MATALDQLRRETHELWQPRTAEPITEADVDEMIANMSEFTAILAEWDFKAKAWLRTRMATRRKMKRLARLPRVSHPT